MKCDLKLFTCVGSKILSANQNGEFLKQLCFKNNGINQPGVLHVDRVSRKINGTDKSVYFCTCRLGIDK